MARLFYIKKWLNIISILRAVWPQQISILKSTDIAVLNFGRIDEAIAMVAVQGIRPVA